MQTGRVIHHCTHLRCSLFWTTTERRTFDLWNETGNHLSAHGTQPYADKHRVPVEALEDVALSVDFTRVDLVEECHQDERVEDNGEVLRWCRRWTGCRFSAVVNVEYKVTCSMNRAHQRKLNHTHYTLYNNVVHYRNVFYNTILLHNAL